MQKSKALTCKKPHEPCHLFRGRPPHGYQQQHHGEERQADPNHNEHQCHRPMRRHLQRLAYLFTGILILEVDADLGKTKPRRTYHTIMTHDVINK